MAFCEKCGANIAEDIKFCDKCGAPTGVGAAPSFSAPTYETPAYETPAPAQTSNGFADKVTSMVPGDLAKPGNMTMQWIGFGAMATLGLVYLIWFFLGMDELCYAIGNSNYFVGNANEFWMVLYFAFNLFPLYFAAKALTDPKYKFLSIFAAATSFTLTIFGAVVCIIMEHLTGIDSANSLAWYCLMDTLSDGWYLKILIAPAVIIGYGVDYFANKKK